MNCPKCGNEIRPGSIFCHNCGTRLPEDDFVSVHPAESRPENRQKKTIVVLIAVIAVLVLLAGLIYWKLFQPEAVQYYEAQKATTVEEQPEEPVKTIETLPIEPKVTDACHEQADWRTYRIPKVELGDISVDEVNLAIYEELSPSLKYDHISGTDYAWSYHDGVVSVLAWVGPYPGGWTSYYSWNISAETGKLLTIAEMAECFGMTEDEFYTKAKTLMVGKIEHWLDNTALLMQGIEDTGSKENMDRVRPYINADGNLCIAGKIETFAGAGMYYKLYELESGEEDYSGHEKEPETESGYPAYEQKIRQYAGALAMTEEAFQEKYAHGQDCSSINALCMYPGMELSYALYDLDKNGTPELFIGDNGHIIDIYLLKDGNLVRPFVDDSFGYRANLSLLTNGKMRLIGSSGASSGTCEYYCIADDGVTVVMEYAYYWDGMSGRSEYMDATHTFIVLDDGDTAPFAADEELDILSELTWLPVGGVMKEKRIATHF